MSNPFQDNPAIKAAIDNLAGVIAAEYQADRAKIKRWSLFALTVDGDTPRASAGCMCQYCSAVVTMAAAMQAGTTLTAALQPALRTLLGDNPRAVH